MNLDLASGEDLAIILSTKPASGTGLFVTLMTLRSGKVSCLAAGIRQGTSRLCGSVEPLNLVSVRTGSTEPTTLRDAKIIEDFPEIKSSWRSTHTALELSTAVDALTAHQDPQPRIFALLLHALTSLATADPAASSNALRMRLLMETGHRPTLERCTSCQGPATPPCHYHYAQGGPVCSSCPPPPANNGHYITEETLQELRQLYLGITPPDFNGAHVVIQRSIDWQSA